MSKSYTHTRVTISACLMAIAAVDALAGPVYQPPGVNLVFGDVTHGQRAMSASSNAAAAAADTARGIEKITRGTVLSASVGIEYGNIDNLFKFYDDLSKGHTPSPVGPTTLPEVSGIDLGEVWDSLDPEFTSTVEAAAKQVGVMASLLAIVREDGYARAWLAADAPFVLGKEHLGGTWTFGANWSGMSKAFGVTDSIEFDLSSARNAIEDWWNQLPTDRPSSLAVSDDVLLDINPTTNAVRFAIRNDSSMLIKATKTTELNLGYSRPAWSNSSGTLYLGAEARLYLMQLSRFSVRLGDIADSEELFDEIKDADFHNDDTFGLDLGALWVAENFQVGAQVSNVNEPQFSFPDVDLQTYSSDSVIGFLKRDQVYRMDRQFKLEASMFSKDRRWSAHFGLDVDPATDPMGDEFQWVTASAGFATDSWWLPSARIGYRENLAGTQLKYLGVGVTAFKIVNIDIASAMDTVEIDGQKLPQGLMLSVGFQLSW